MPRARVLWPEHRAHRKVGTLTDTHYRLWVGLVMEADDDGRVLIDTFELRAKIFPFRPTISLATIKTGVRNLARRKLIGLYQRAGVHYAYFPSWRDWQHPKYPTPSKLPPPPKIPPESTVSTPLRHRSPRGSPHVPHHSPPYGVGSRGEERGRVGRGVRAARGARRPSRSRSRRDAHASQTPKDPAPAFIADVDERMTNRMRKEETP